MKVALLTVCGLILGAGGYLLQNSLFESDEIASKNEITSALEMNIGDCLVQDGNSQSKAFFKVGCKSEFNYYVFTRMRYMHQEFMLDALKSDGKKYCPELLQWFVNKKGYSAELKTTAVIPEFFEWTGEFNSIKCIAYKEDYSLLSLKDIGK